MAVIFMNSRRIDIVGNKYNRWTVISYAGKNRHGNVMWECKCECGTVKAVMGSSLKGGKSKSCGCYNVERAIEQGKKNKKHGMSRNRLHRIWCNIKSRCNNPNVRSYEFYGKKGIRVDAVWDDFIDFKKWSLDNGYNDELTLDRIDYNGNYSPNNCRWIPMNEQYFNRSDNVYIEVEGERKVLTELAREHDLKPSLLLERYRNGSRTIEELIRPLYFNNKKNFIIHNGEKLYLSDLSKKHDIKYQTLYKRFKRGIDKLEELIKK